MTNIINTLTQYVGAFAPTPEVATEVQYWVQHNLKNYLEKGQSKVVAIEHTDMEHVLDFLMSDKAPKRLRKMSVKQAVALTEKNDKALAKGGKTTTETKEDIQVVRKWKEFSLVKLKSKAAFEREGKLMSHCVASYYNREGIDIYSLRDGQNKPHCTMEVRSSSDRIEQIKGKGNGNIHPKYIIYVLRSLKLIGKEINEYELEHLGYADVSSLDSTGKYAKKHLPMHYLKQENIEMFEYLVAVAKAKIIQDKYKCDTNAWLKGEHKDEAKFMKMKGKDYFYLDSPLKAKQV